MNTFVYVTVVTLEKKRNLLTFQDKRIHKNSGALMGSNGFQGRKFAKHLKIQ